MTSINKTWLNQHESRGTNFIARAAENRRLCYKNGKAINFQFITLNSFHDSCIAATENSAMKIWINLLIFGSFAALVASSVLDTDEIRKAFDIFRVSEYFLQK